MIKELYILVNKNNGEIIRSYEAPTGCTEFGDRWYLSEYDFENYWFVENAEDIQKIISKDEVHPRYSQFRITPSHEFINLEDYEIKKVTISYE